MTRMCRDKNAIAHDDRLDAVTMATSYWLDNMDVDSDRLPEVSEMELEDWINDGLLKRAEPTNRCLRNIRDLRG